MRKRRIDFGSCKPHSDQPTVISPDLALPDLPDPERRKLLTSLGLTVTGIAAGWPTTVLPAARGSYTNTAPSPVARFTGSSALATALVQKALKETATSSISMALISDKGLLWAHAIGNMGDAAKSPVTTETLYCIGSCSKLIATVAALQLADRGLIELDTAVTRYLPDFSMQSPEFRNVTVRMLLNHQSGFPGSDFSNSFTTLPFPGYSGQVLQTLFNARLKHRPGEMSVYCNDGFTLIEHLVRTVTGMAYTDYVRRNILDPLGMINSRYATALFPKGTFAPGYDTSDTPFLECVNPYASGGLYTTPSEMAGFARVFLNKGQVDGVALLSESAVQSMAELQTTHESLRPVPVSWGFGLGWDDVHQGAFACRGIRAWSKSGGTSVYGSELYVLPDHGLAFMITGTSSNYKPEAIAEQVLYEALREHGIVEAPPAIITALPAGANHRYAAPGDQVHGIYANYQAVYRISPSSEPDTVEVEKWQDTGWSKHATWRRRADGLLVGAEAPLTGFGLSETADHKYLTLHTPTGAGYNWLDIAFAQAPSRRPPVPQAWRSRLGHRWVVINERYTSLILAWRGPLLTLFEIPDLPGYIGVNSSPSNAENQLLAVSEPDAARMFLKIPYTQSRDLNDLLVDMIDGQEHLRFGRGLFRRLETFAEIVDGSTERIEVSAQGHAIGFRASSSMRIEVSGALAAFVYGPEFRPVFPIQFRTSVDGVLRDGTTPATNSHPAAVDLPAGGLVLLYGEPGTTIAVRGLA